MEDVKRFWGNFFEEIRSYDMKIRKAKEVGLWRRATQAERGEMPVATTVLDEHRIQKAMAMSRAISPDILHMPLLWPGSILAT